MYIFSCMRKGADSRGLSPVIASVMMILLVLVLAALIFLWARGFVSEQIEKFGKPIEQLCSSVDFEIERIGDDLEVVNRGNVDIRYLDIKIFDDGDSRIEKFNFQVDVGESVRREAVLTIEGNDVPDKIVAYPVLVGSVKGGDSNRVFTCLDVGKVI